MSNILPAPRFATPDYEYIAKLAGTPAGEDGPIFMVNLMKYRAVADYGDGRASGRTGREADDLYAPREILHDIGAEIVFAADVEQQLLGDPHWDRVAIVRYPTRAAFLAMPLRRDFQEKRVHKEAGMEQTIVMACVPEIVPTLPPPAPVELAAGDQPFVMLHVLRFAEGGEAKMAQYGASAGAAGLALGVRPQAYFAVEGTVLGDGRQWDQVRFNSFPSHEIYRELRANSTHKAAQPDRAAALTDTFTLMLLPRINRLGAAANG